MIDFKFFHGSFAYTKPTWVQFIRNSEMGEIEEAPSNDTQYFYIGFNNSLDDIINVNVHVVDFVWANIYQDSEEVVYEYIGSFYEFLSILLRNNSEIHVNSFFYLNSEPFVKWNTITFQDGVFPFLDDKTIRVYYKIID